MMIDKKKQYGQQSTSDDLITITINKPGEPNRGIVDGNLYYIDKMNKHGAKGAHNWFYAGDPDTALGSETLLSILAYTKSLTRQEWLDLTFLYGRV